MLFFALAGCGGGTSQDATETVAEPSEASATENGTEAGAAAQVEPDRAAPEPAQPAPTQTLEPTAAPVPTPAAASAAQDAADSTVELVVFNDDFSTSIAPIFAEHCASCHNAGGPGASHWQLEQASDLVETHQWIGGVVSTGYMPPWPASDLSLPFHDNRSLRADQITAIQAWAAAGGPIDVAASTAIVSTEGVVMLDADVELSPAEPFQGSTAVVDDYRCLIYEIGLDEPQWLEGFEFVPDQTQIVHHAIGYLAPARDLSTAQFMADRDELGGWQCYGGSGLPNDQLILGWAPGQLPTQFPEGSGVLVEPGDFMVLQIHYHFDTADAPEDASTIRLDWSDEEELDEIEFDEFIAPAEIPCASSETGPLCDRDVALAAAYEKYGVQGVLADGINRVCGVGPEDFADMTNGIATSSCVIPIRNAGEIVSVFGHQHEIGLSIRMTLNAGQPDERILLDIPDWDFDWQYNYYPSESIVIDRDDELLLECAWDRSRRSPDLEPAYVVWADGTNDEMCFATISTRAANTTPPSAADADPAQSDPFDAAGIDIGFPADIESCLNDAGVAVDRAPIRSEIDATVDALFTCAEPDEVGAALTDVIASNFGGLVGDDGLACLADGLSTKDAARSLLIFTLPDATTDERLPVAELVGDCVSLSDALAEFGFPLPESTHPCIDEAGRDLLVQATLDGELPEEQTLFGAINPCLSGG